MNKLEGTAEAFVVFYTGDAENNIPAVGPCGVLYDVDNNGNLRHILLLSDQEIAPSISYTVTNTVSEEAWLAMGPEPNTTYDIQPIKTTSIDINTGVIECSGETIQSIIGNLPTGQIIYTTKVLSGDDVLNEVGFCSLSEQGVIKLHMIASDRILESDWLTLVSAAIKVDSFV